VGQVFFDAPKAPPGLTHGGALGWPSDADELPVFYQLKILE
jgi:hypothetical protein